MVWVGRLGRQEAEGDSPSSALGAGDGREVERDGEGSVNPNPLAKRIGAGGGEGEVRLFAVTDLYDRGLGGGLVGGVHGVRVGRWLSVCECGLVSVRFTDVQPPGGGCFGLGLLDGDLLADVLKDGLGSLLVLHEETAEGSGVVPVALGVIILIITIGAMIGGTRAGSIRHPLLCVLPSVVRLAHPALCEPRQSLREEGELTERPLGAGVVGDVLEFGAEAETLVSVRPVEELVQGGGEFLGLQRGLGGFVAHRCAVGWWWEGLGVAGDAVEVEGDLRGVPADGVEPLLVVHGRPASEVVFGLGVEFLLDGGKEGVGCLLGKVVQLLGGQSGRSGRGGRVVIDRLGQHLVCVFKELADGLLVTREGGKEVVRFPERGEEASQRVDAVPGDLVSVRDAGVVACDIVGEFGEPLRNHYGIVVAREVAFPNAGEFGAVVGDLLVSLDEGGEEGFFVGVHCGAWVGLVWCWLP